MHTHNHIHTPSHFFMGDSMTYVHTYMTCTSYAQWLHTPIRQQQEVLKEAQKGLLALCKVIQCQECLPLLHILGQLQLSQPQNEETQQAAHVKRHRIVRSNCANNYIFTTYLTSSTILSQLWQHRTPYIHSTLSPLAIEKPCSKITYYTATNCNYAKHTYIHTYVCTCMLTMYKTMSQQCINVTLCSDFTHLIRWSHY